jgi:hypothetical protein
MSITINTTLQSYGLTDLVLSNAATPSASGVETFFLNAFDGASVIGTTTLNITSVASLPSSGTAGQLVYLNTGVVGLYYFDGTAFVEFVNQIPYASTVVANGTSLPSSPTAGQLFYLTQSIHGSYDDGLYLFNGGVWVNTKTDYNFNKVTWEVSVRNTATVPLVAPVAEFPTNHGQNFGSLGNLWNLTATDSSTLKYTTLTPGLYITTGYVAGNLSYTQITGQTVTTDFFELFASVGKAFPVAPVAGQLFYKTTSDVTGSSALYVFTTDWELASV